MSNKHRIQNSIRRWMVFFILALFISGVTAIPVQAELSWLVTHFPFEGSIKNYFIRVLYAINDVSDHHPFLFYGYDWLAFAHFLFAILFIGVYRDPVKNKWILEFGIIACLLVIPFALVAGSYRELPAWWRLVDCSFGIFGALPLLRSLFLVKKLELEMEGENQLETFYREPMVNRI